MERLLNRRQVADLAGASESSVKRWCRRGWLEKVAIGRVVRFRREDLRALVARGVVSAPDVGGRP